MAKAGRGVARDRPGVSIKNPALDHSAMSPQGAGFGPWMKTTVGSPSHEPFLWMLLAFAGWTLLVLLVGVGVYRGA